MDGIRFNPISSIEMFILVLVIFAIFFILFLGPRINKRKLVNKNEHGSSKFADMKEIEKTFVKASSLCPPCMTVLSCALMLASLPRPNHSC